MVGAPATDSSACTLSKEEFLLRAMLQRRDLRVPSEGHDGVPQVSWGGGNHPGHQGGGRAGQWLAERETDWVEGEVGEVRELKSVKVRQPPAHPLRCLFHPHLAPCLPACQVEDPSKYGVVIMDDTGKIDSFVEKPKVGGRAQEGHRQQKRQASGCSRGSAVLLLSAPWRLQAAAYALLGSATSTCRL